MPRRAQEDDSVHRRKACRWAALAAIAATASVWTMVGPLTAQTSPPQASATKVWPTKRVQVIVPFAPGSATDLLPRMVFEQVAANVGQTIFHRKPTGRGWGHRRQRRCQGGGGRPHHSGPFQCAGDRAGDPAHAL